MAGTCKKCGCMTTDTRGRSPLGLCFNCQHGLTRDLATISVYPETVSDLSADTIDHLAFSIVHGTFDEGSPGGCSCEFCAKLSNRIDELYKEEAAKFYAEHYPPPGGFL